jgi:RNA polymerase sigma-70 factor (ECF subfamily)
MGATRTSVGTPFDDVLRAAQAGAEWAVERLYREYAPSLLRYLQARAPGESEDLASQTWLAVAEGLPEFEGGEEHFRRWLYTVANRRLIDSLRRRSRANGHAISLDEVGHTLASPSDPAAEVTDAIAGDQAARLIAALLPAEQAEVVLLRVVAGLSVDEVAAVTGKRPGTVRVIAHRALRRLAVALTENPAVL